MKYKFEGEDQFSSGTIEDLCWGGVFLRTNPPAAQGKRMVIEFDIPGENVNLDVWGTVVRVREKEAGKPSGVGIQFDELDQETRGQIQSLVDYWVRYLVGKMKK